MPVMNTRDRQYYLKTVMKKVTMQSSVIKQICFIHNCFIHYEYCQLLCHVP